MKEIAFNKPMKYKEIVAVMGEEPVTSTDSRKAQLKRWQKEYEIVKEKTYYTIIRELTNEEKEILVNKGEYLKYIENNLIKILKEKNDNSFVIFTYRDLFERLGIVNKTFYEVLRPSKPNDIGEKVYCNIVSHSLKTDYDNVFYNLNKFFECSESLLKRMIKAALDSMQKRCVIIYSKSYRLYRKVELSTGVTYIEKHDCTDEENSIMMDIYNQVMGEYKVRKINQIYVMHFIRKRQFFDDIKKQVKEKLNYDNYSPIFKIMLGKSAIDIDYKDNLNKKRFNTNIRNKLITSTIINKSVAEVLRDRFIDDLINISK